MNLLVFLFVIIASIPAFYVALRKDFITIPNEKCNTYLLRLLIIYPVVAGCSLFISVLMYLSLEYFLHDLAIFAEYEFLKYLILLIPFPAGILTIGIFKIFILKKEIISKTLVIKDQLFVYFPKKRMFIHNYGTKYSYPKRKQGELLVGYQATDLIIGTNEINEKILYTGDGELIVNEQTLSIFKEQNLTGFSTRAVQYKGKNSSEEKHYQILTTNAMPSISPKTKIKRSNIIYKVIIAVNYELYYEQKSLRNKTDFNSSMEYFGSENHTPYSPQRYWIVSPKVKELFIQQLGQKEQDFIPVIIIKDEEPQSDFETDE